MSVRGLARSLWRRSGLEAYDVLTILVLSLLPFLFFSPLFIPGASRHFMEGGEGGDFVDQFYAFAAYEVRAFAEGRLPLWNPYAYAGSPFWADVQAAVAYPPSLLVVIGSALALGRLPYLFLELEAVAHLALAAVFMFFFARYELGSRSAAALSAIVFSLGGYLTGYPPLQLAVLETAVWLPLVLLGVGRTLDCREDRNRVSAGAIDVAFPHPGLPIGLGLAVLAGHSQTALYLVYAATLYAAWRAWPWRDVRPHTWLRLAVGLVVGVGLSAAGWLPALEFMRLSTRGAADFATVSHGFPPRELLGAVLAGTTKWSPLYVGVLPLLLAAIAAWRALQGANPRSKRRLVWVALGVLALLLSLGGGSFLFDLFYLAAPGFDLFRGQERSAFIVSFCLAILAGEGLSAWLPGRSQPDEGKSMGRVLANSALVLCGIGLFLALVSSSADNSPALRLLFVSGGVAAIAALRSSPRFGPRVWLAAAVGLVLVDLYSANAGVDLHRDPPSEILVSDVVEELKAEGTQRVQLDYHMPPYFGLRPNFGVLHSVEATSGASPLELKTHETLARGLAGAPVRLRDLLAVSHVVTGREMLEVPAEKLLARGEATGVPGRLFRLDNPTPFAWRAAASRSVASDAEALELMLEEGTGPLAAVILHEPEDHAGPGQFGGLGVARRRPGETVVSTTGDGPAWVVFSEMYYPGWRATVDGEEEQVRRADIALMAVPVPSGDHEVRLYFTAPLVYAGIGLSAAIALLYGALWAGQLREERARSAVRRRKQASGEDGADGAAETPRGQPIGAG